MRITALQMNCGSAKADNIAQATHLIDSAMASDRPDLVSLPEMWSCLGGDRQIKFEQSEVLPAAGSNEPGGEAYEFLRRTARELGAPRYEVAEALEWQPHTVRGAIAGALKKKLGLDVTSEKDDKRGRVYRIVG